VKKTLAVTVAVVFVLAFAAPVFAQSMNHNVTYEMDGTIDLEKQVGHLCNTGAEMKQVIEGEGEMTKVMDTAQVQGVLTVSDEQDWITAEDAVRNLTVTSVIELCAPAKHEATAEEFVYGDEAGWQLLASEDYIPSPHELYETGAQDTGLREWALAAHPDAEDQAAILNMSDEELRAAFADHTFPLEDGDGNVIAEDARYMTNEYTALTDQIWAAQVEAEPGFSGNLHQDFEAAYGPFGGVIEDPEGAVPGNVDGRSGDDFWFFQPDAVGAVGVTAGDDYVGNYFNIDQMARTSQGTVRRYIDISSPWSHAYLYEDMEVVGMAEIEEDFAMDNLAPGEEAVPEWWDLF